MAGLNDTQASILRTLFGSAPDVAVRDLERALSEEAMGLGAMAQVYRLIAKEALERRAKQTVFEPLIALCGAVSNKSPRPFPSSAPKALWVALRQTCAADADTAVSCVAKKRPTDEELARAAEVYDRLCVAAAAGLRDLDPAFAHVTELLDADRSDGAAIFANYLDLTPVARAAMVRLPEWVARMTDDRAAAVRVAYKDAVSLAEDAGPRLIEILVANLSEPWLIVRVLSAVMTHPQERYVAASELAGFAERILDDIDLKLSEFRSFDPADGRAAGLAAGQAIHLAGLEIIEFETAVELSREGPWGKRIAQQKQSLAELAELRLAQIDKALDAALPLQMVKFGKGLRGHPRLTDDPNPTALTRAEGLLGFFDYSRQFASQSGYGAARTRTAEKIEARLDQYIEDLLELLHGHEVEALERVRLYLDAAAATMVAVRGEKAGQIVRRRVAAA
jgi:hypothetical protein